MKRISLLLALTVLTGAMWGCGSTDSSSESAAASTAAATTAAPTTEAATKPRVEGMNYYDTKDGRFTFALSSDFKDYEGSELTDCEYSFTPDGLSAVGFMSLCDYHFTARGFTEDMASDFEKDFDNVEWKETTVNGLPAVEFTAVKNVDGVSNTFEYCMVQYGNGDLFMVATGTPAVSSYKIDIDEIFSNVEYRGEPLKTGSEVCDGGSFELTVPEEFYVSMNKGGKVELRHNLADSLNEYMCRFNIAVEEGTSAKEVFTEKAKSRYENNNTTQLKQDEVEFLGHDAYSMYWTITTGDYRLESRAWYFEENGKVYSVTCLASDEQFEKFSAECQPIMDSLTFK